LTYPLLFDPFIQTFFGTVRGIAGDIEKFAFLFAYGAFLRRALGLKGISAFGALPG
jgi:hypothetical protein